MAGHQTRHGRNPQKVRAAMRLVSLGVALLAVGSAGAQAKSSGGYTSAQSSRGAAVYSQDCAQCHGANLQGDSGPTLSGQTFQQAYGTGTAAQLYDFISRQMPQDEPGSLSQQQYLDVTGYILSQNGIRSDNSPLSIASLGQIRMSEQRVNQSTPGPNTDEIVRAAPPVR